MPLPPPPRPAAGPALPSYRTGPAASRPRRPAAGFAVTGHTLVAWRHESRRTGPDTPRPPRPSVPARPAPAPAAAARDGAGPDAAGRGATRPETVRPPGDRAGPGGPASAGDRPPGHRPPPRPRSPLTRWTAPYAKLFAVPGARAFTLGNLLARLPMGMFTVSAVLMIAGSRGSYALAGAVTATGLAATAVVGPWTARLVDRYGQARVAVPAALLAVCGSLALAVCVRYGAPAWTLFVCYAFTATTPNTGGMSRARWAHLFRDDPAARHTANSFEQAADELCFMAGPVLAGVLCTALFPEAGTLTGCLLLTAGILLFAAQRRTEPPVPPRTATRASAPPVRLPGMPPLLAAFLATGGIFGAMEVVTVAYADAHGSRGAAGAVLAVPAAGSAIAGLVVGSLTPAGPLVRQLLRRSGAMAGLLLLPLAASTTHSLPVLCVALLLAGVGTAPTMVTGMTLLQRIVPAARLNEGMTLAVTALLGGTAAGSAVGGWTVDRVGGGGAAYCVPAGAALLAALVTCAGRASFRRAPAPREADGPTGPDAEREPGGARESGASPDPGGPVPEESTEPPGGPEPGGRPDGGRRTGEPRSPAAPPVPPQRSGEK